MKTLRLVLWIAVVLVAGLLGWLTLEMTRTKDQIAGEPFGVPFQLVAQDGTPVTEKAFTGKPTALFFGFTHCPEVCPTTLGDVASWQDELGEDGKALRVFFVTVDPERDSVETLREYVSWVPGVIGVSGAPEEVAKAIKAFRIYARKSPMESGDYTMDHSSTMLLFDANGDYAGLIGYQEERERALASLRKLLNS